MTPSGIEPVSLKFVAQCLDKLCLSLSKNAALCQLILNGPDTDVTVRTNLPTFWLFWYITGVLISP